MALLVLVAYPAHAFHPAPQAGLGGVALDLASRAVLTGAALDDPAGRPPELKGMMAMKMGHHRFMLRYRFGLMGMEGLRQGRSRISTAQVLEQFPVTPEQMSMQMHMVELMTMTDRRNMLMLMGSYKSLSMRHRTRMGTQFVTRSRGLGDLKLVWQHSPRGMMAPGTRYKLGLSLPTGSVSKRGRTPMNESAKLPYAMQLGSGTWDLILGAEREWGRGRTRWGVSLEGTIRTGRNSSGYRLGNELSAELWRRLPLSNKSELRLSLMANAWQDIRGSDPELNSDLVPTAGPHIQGGTWLGAGAQLTLVSRRGQGREEGLMLGIELPLYQNLHGPQLERDYRLTMSGFLRW